MAKVNATLKIRHIDQDTLYEVIELLKAEAIGVGIDIYDLFTTNENRDKA